MSRPAAVAARDEDGRPQAPSDARIALSATLVALYVSVALVSLLIWAYGESPRAIYTLLFRGTWGSVAGIGQVLFKATPLIFTGLSVAVGLRAGLFNIGAEGQLIVGAFGCALVGLYLPAGTPCGVGAIVAIAGAYFGGALWGGLAGQLKARFGAHEVINTMMLNFLGAALTGFLVNHYFKVRESVHTAPVKPAAYLMRLGEVVPAWRGSAVNLAFGLAVVAALVTGWLLFRTGFGFALRATGHSPEAARVAGLRTDRITVWAMAVAGGLAGLGGANFVLGYKHYFEEGFSGGVGFFGIAVALLARNHPVLIIPAALFFGTLSQGALAINKVIPKELIDVAQAVIILAIASTPLIISRLLRHSSAQRRR